MKINASTIIMTVALIVWSAFYLMDRHWYHRLLYGAVKQGKALESRIQSFMPELALTDTIGKESPIIFKRLFNRAKTRKLDSKKKMDIFYGVIAVSIFCLIIGTMFFR